jgi:hypothetical protein
MKTFLTHGRNLLLTLLLFPSLSYAATYHVRTDGGTPTQCNGLFNTPFSASITNKACAWKHPYYALGYLNGDAARMIGGDTLIIHKGSFKMGYDSSFPSCSTSYTYDCRARAIPTGTATAHTKILGEGYDTGCLAAPELWGSDKAYAILELNKAKYVDVQCLEITDHSSCRANGPATNRCNGGTYPYGSWAQLGIFAQDSSNINLTDVNIHGLGFHGLYTARLADWNLNRVKINGNGQAGWHGEAISGNSSNSGLIAIRNSQVKWNGCAEKYPEKTSPVVGSCCSQSQGCYNDGIGMADTGGNYLIEGSNVSFNAEDGIDLLHVTLNQPTSIIVRRTIAQGNAGNGIKTGATNVVLENNIAVSGCQYLQDAGYTAAGWASNDNTCRAGGEPIAVNIDAGSHQKIYNNTIVQTNPNMNSSIVSKGSSRVCDGTEDLSFVNNIWLGGNYLQYNAVGGCQGFTPSDIKNTYSDVYQVRSGCPAGTGNICTNPQLNGFLLSPLKYIFGASTKLTIDSPVRNKATKAITFTDTSNDFHNFPRGTSYDMGALEYGSSAQ